MGRERLAPVSSVLRSLVFLLLVGWPTLDSAQTASGLISGTVADPSRAIVPGAKVVAFEIHTGSYRSATTNADGFYSFSDLHTGDYDVSIEISGFARYVARVEVSVGSRITLDPILSVQPVRTQSVVLAEGGVQVETQTQMISEVINRQQITELPTENRNPYFLIGLAGNLSPSDTTGQGVGVAINGLRAASTAITLDGAGNMDSYTASVGMAVPLESVQEFRVSESTFTAEYGRASGGVVEVETRSGTNQFHGTIYEFNRVSALAANTFDNNARGFPRAVFTRNQFGYAVGGPVFKDKLFFFQSTEWIRVRSQQSNVALVPTPEFISASAAETEAYFTAFSGGLNPINGPIITKADLLNAGLVPNPGGPFDLLPMNFPVFGQVTRILPANAGAGDPQNTYSLVARLDYNPSDRAKLFARFALQKRFALPGVASSSPYPQYDTSEFVLNKNALLGFTYVFSPALVSQTKVSFSRLDDETPLGKAPPGPRMFFPSAFQPGGLPIVLPGYEIDPSGVTQYSTEISQDLSWTKGRHLLRAGGLFFYLRTARQGFSGLLGLEDLGRRARNSLDNFLLGQTNAFTVAIDPQGQSPCFLDPMGNPIVTPACTLSLPLQSPDSSRFPRNRDGALYVQDSWRIHKRLTLNLGLRWEYYGVQYSRDTHRESNFYLGPGDSLPARIRSGQVLSVADSPIHSLWNPDHNNFGPRLGFAWDVFGDGKTSLRGGYGISFERNFGFVFENLIFNPPGYALAQLQSGTAEFPTLKVYTDNLGPLSGSSGLLPYPESLARQVDQNLRTAYAETWSLSVDRELLPNTVLSVGFSGSHGVKLYSDSRTSGFGSGVVYAGDDPALNSFSPLNLQYTDITDRTNGGFSTYNALLISLKGQNIHKTGLTLTANYTWSHAIDNLSSTLSLSPNAYNVGFLDYFNPLLDRGDAEFDIRNRFVTSAIWQVPFFASSPRRWERLALGGWTLSSIFTASSGSPFSVFDCSNAEIVCPRYIPSAPVSHTGHAVDAGAPNFFQYIPLSPAVPYVNPLVGFSDFPDCSSVPAPPCPFPAAMSRRDDFRGAGQWNLDLGIYKDFHVHEGWTLQFRGEMFNALNHPNLVVDTGLAEISANPDFISARKSGSRNVQLALKLSF